MCMERLQTPVIQRNNMIVNGWYYCPAGHKTGQRIEKNSNIENKGSPTGLPKMLY